MADRLTEAVLYELLETGTEEGVYVEAFDPRPRPPGTDPYEAQRAATVTVAELAGALLASQAELARQTAELAGELIAARALNTKLLAEAKRERERAAEHAEVLRGFTDDGETIVDAARRVTAGLHLVGADAAVLAIPGEAIEHDPEQGCERCPVQSWNGKECRLMPRFPLDDRHRLHRAPAFCRLRSEPIAVRASRKDGPA
jgi:hypothetical protein